MGFILYAGLNGPVQLENHNLSWWGHSADIASYVPDQALYWVCMRDTFITLIHRWQMRRSTWSAYNSECICIPIYMHICVCMQWPMRSAQSKSLSDLSIYFKLDSTLTLLLTQINGSYKLWSFYDFSICFSWNQILYIHRKSIFISNQIFYLSLKKNCNRIDLISWKRKSNLWTYFKLKNKILWISFEWGTSWLLLLVFKDQFIDITSNYITFF